MHAQNILIRCDSSSEIGVGHLMRSLVLAEQFLGATITFATLDLSNNRNDLIKEAGYAHHLLHSNTFAELDALVKQQGIDLLILDHYALDYGFEKQLKAANSALTLMVLDDTYAPHFCDILLNHNIYAEAKKYKDLVPAWCELRCGAQYTLLRKEFAQQKEFSVVVVMGGADTLALSPQILKMLLRYPQIKVDLITSSANKNLEKLKRLGKKHKRVCVHCDTKELGLLARQSHFAIISASVVANEFYKMGIPFIAIQTAPNQKEMRRFLKKEGYRVLKRFDAQKLLSFIEEYLR